MKKLLIIIISVMLLSSCASLYSTEIANENMQQTSEPSEITRVLKPEYDLVYRNYIAGYQLTFPESWLGWLVITEYSNGDIVIGFYGRSRTSQIAHKSSNRRYGIDMFMIIADPPYGIGGGHKIGEISGVEYFFGRWGGMPSNILSLILEPDGWAREFYGELWEFEFDETELALVAQDNEKLVRIIQEDLWNVEDVIFPTFQAIE